MDVSAPSRIQVNTDAQTLAVEWADGDRSVFLLSRLRAACPCASCKGKAVDYIPPPDETDATPDRRWTDLDIEPTGSIGIRITWDDGHSAGIFRWDRLRRLQPKRDE